MLKTNTVQPLVKFVLLFYSLLPLALHAQDDNDDEPMQPRRQAAVLPALIRGPYLQAASDKSIVIRWRTNALARSRVSYGLAPGQLTNKVEETALTTEHSIRLTGLAPHTKYYYAIGDIKTVLQGDSTNYFFTLPMAGTTGFYRVGMFGDCGTNSPKQRSVRDQFLKYLGNNYLDAWTLLGDNAYPNATDVEYQSNFFNVYKEDLLKNCPLFPAPGNHDYHDLDYSAAAAQKSHQVAYYQNFTMPEEGESGGQASHTQSYYSFDIGNAHFLSLDSYGEGKDAKRLYDPSGEQVKWIKKDLAKNKNKGWVIAYWHHPPYTMGTHNSDRETELVKIREQFLQVLEKAGVDLVICGHSHVYERSKLMNGYYGLEADFDGSKYNKSNSSGTYDGSSNSCPYIIDPSNKQHGMVYVVTGSAGKIGPTQATWPHNAMHYSNASVTGATLLEIQANRLDLKWVCSDGVVRDHFTMMKGVNTKSAIKAKSGQAVTLTASFIGSYRWSNSKETTRSIQVHPPTGKTIYTVSDTQTCLQDSFEVEVKD